MTIKPIPDTATKCCAQHPKPVAAFVFMQGASTALHLPQHHPTPPPADTRCHDMLSSTCPYPTTATTTRSCNHTFCPPCVTQQVLTACCVCAVLKTPPTAMCYTPMHDTHCMCWLPCINCTAPPITPGRKPLCITPPPPPPAAAAAAAELAAACCCIRW